MPKKKPKSNKDHRAYKYKLIPTEEQEILINKTIGCSRFIYNKLLSDKTEYYKQEKKTLKKEISEYKKLKEYSFLKEVDSLALANAKINLETAFKNFFEKRAKYPTFHKKGKRDSYTTNSQKSGKGYSIEIVPEGIKLPKLGVVKIKQHRAIGKDETIKSCTISKKAGKYYISVLTEFEPKEIKKLEAQAIADNKIIGIDFSVPHFYVDSNGIEANYPKFYRNAQKKLAKEQKKLSKKEHKSHNYNKQLLKVQKISEHISNQRMDFCHKLSRELVNQYDVFCFEDLNLSNLKRTLKLGKSISDEGFGMFRNFVKYKAEQEGKYFILVDKWFASTKTCSHCGYKNNEITLKTREWICPECGTYHLRDHNAAINIKREGYHILLSL